MRRPALWCALSRGALAALLVLAGGSVAHAGLIDLGTLGGTSSQAWGIRADGSIVVGSSLNGSGSLQGFSWGGGTMTALGFLTGGTAAEARAINASGLIVGYSRDSGAIDQAVTWTGTAPSLIGNTLGGSGARALGVSTGGEVVGWARESSGVQRAFVFSSGAMSALNLTAINGQHDPNAGHSARALGVSPDGRYVVGEFEVDNGLGGAELHGFVYDRTSPSSSYEFSSGGVGSARASNNTHAVGQIFNPPTDTLAAFSLHSGASASFLPSLSGDEAASAINTSGVSVGFQDLGAGRRATAWSGPSVSATFLNLDALHGTGNILVEATGVAETPGLYAGWGTFGGQTHGFLLVVPEPGTMVFFLLGGTLVVVSRRRRR